MYLKYNGVLRGLLFPFARPTFEKLCMGNKYTTTLHAINSAILKLSKLTVAAKVYRGVSGGVMPESCRTRNRFEVKGGAPPPAAPRLARRGGSPLAPRPSRNQ